MFKARCQDDFNQPTRLFHTRIISVVVVAVDIIILNHFNIFISHNKNIFLVFFFNILLKFIQKKLLLLRGVTVCVLAEQQVGSIL